MANMKTGQQIGLNQGKGTAPEGDKLAMFLKVFGGEVLTAFSRASVTTSRVLKRTISNGKSAQFPVIGRTSARYLKAGESLDDGRKDIKHSEKKIDIDGLLTSDVLVYDIEDAMNHYDVRAAYSQELGEAMALSADTANLSEMMKLVNLADDKNENIEGLGSPVKVEISKYDMETDTGLLDAGKAILHALTRARAGFTKNRVPRAERFAYVTPEAFSAILTALMPNAANYAALIDPETGTLKNIMGFEIIETPNFGLAMVDDPSAALDGVGHVFPMTGFVNTSNVQAVLSHRSAVGELTLKDMALERVRRADLQADEIIAKYAKGHGGLRPEAVGAIVSKAAAGKTAK